ncbi:hypothetical protein TeGR_g10325, partial [Tetraparma gracilis]
MGLFGNLFSKKDAAPATPADPNADVKAPPPSKKAIDELAKNGKFVFNKSEMTKLKNRFEVIANSETGLVDKTVLYNQPEFSCCLAMVMLCVENVIKKSPTPAAPSTPAPPAAGGEQPPALERASTFKRKMNEQLTYEQFLQVYSFLSPKTSREVKEKFIFDALDAAGDGLLE